MNVIIANKNKYLLENLGIDIIKELDGEFDVDTIISTFQNFFYQRMILDITALKDYTDIKTLQKLSISLDMNKLILLLDNTPSTVNPTFVSNLVSMGIYNFAKDAEGIGYLYNTPNTYRDVAQYHQLEPTVETQPVKQIERVNDVIEQTRIIGIKNITKQSGATSLTYMMKKELSKNYSVIAIELDKNDFNYFSDKDMISTSSSAIGTIINNNKDKEVILIDLNNSMMAEGFCTEILYLIEPSIIKLNKLLLLNSSIFGTLKNKKVILNQSLLTNNDVATFEGEASIKVFYNLIPLNERSANLIELNKMLIKLGFSRQQNNI